MCRDDGINPPYASTVTIQPVNPAPVDPNDTNRVTENTVLAVDAANGLLNGATDADGDPLNITEFTIPGVAGTHAAGDAVTIPGVGTVQIFADGAYTFGPAAGYTGPVPVITYTVADGNGDTDISTLALTVAPDTDGDGLADPDDLDDDNDGILDTVEGMQAFNTSYDFASIAGTGSEALVNNSGFTVGGAEMNLALSTTGAATITTDQISDVHFNGEFGVRIGQPGTASSPSDTIVADFTFSQEVSDFSFQISDIDLGDSVTINAYRNGVLVALDATNISTANPTIVNYDGANTLFASNADELFNDTRLGSATVSFTQPIDRLEIVYFDTLLAGSITVSKFEAASGFTGRDTDGDGVFDHLDLDSDNDGISDLRNRQAEPASPRPTPTTTARSAWPNPWPSAPPEPATSTAMA